MKLRRVAAYAAVFVLWGGSYFAIRILVHAIPPVLAAAVRYSASGLLLLLLGFCRHHPPLPTLRQLWHCALTGASLIFLVFAPVFWAETRVASWVVAVLTSTNFLWTYLGESLILRTQRLRPVMLSLLALGLAGIFCLSKTSSSQEQPVSLIAIAAILFSSFSWSMSAIALKRIDLPESYLQTGGFQMVFAGALLGILSCMLSEWRHLPALASLRSTPVIWSMLYLVVGGSTIAFAAFHWLIRREPASRIASSSYINPIVALLIGITVGHERISSQQLAGATAILASVVLTWFLFNRSGSSASRRTDQGAAFTLDAIDRPVA
ncbi:EamA family transporter [Silvibacterium acidisoli]|uniref:EamA family transporter n=1 Tax=Acidobacteriaceae bacterium ZG23-2 TaxID=2883246 RepID=UPI00406C8DEA